MDAVIVQRRAKAQGAGAKDERIRLAVQFLRSHSRLYTPIHTVALKRKVSLAEQLQSRALGVSVAIACKGRAGRILRILREAFSLNEQNTVANSLHIPLLHTLAVSGYLR